MIAALLRIGLVTAGAGLLGFSVSRLLRHERSGRQVAEDWLVGLAAIVVGVSGSIRGDLGTGVRAAGVALIAGYVIVSSRGVKRDREKR